MHGAQKEKKKMKIKTVSAVLLTLAKNAGCCIVLQPLLTCALKTHTCATCCVKPSPMTLSALRLQKPPNTLQQSCDLSTLQSVNNIMAIGQHHGQHHGHRNSFPAQYNRVYETHDHTVVTAVNTPNALTMSCEGISTQEHPTAAATSSSWHTVFILEDSKGTTLGAAGATAGPAPWGVGNDRGERGGGNERGGLEIHVVDKARKGDQNSGKRKGKRKNKVFLHTHTLARHAHTSHTHTHNTHTHNTQQPTGGAGRILKNSPHPGHLYCNMDALW